MLLQMSSWPEIEAYLTRSKGILVPIGSIEQHGPTGLIGTDVICPEVIAKRAALQADILIAPTFNVGCAPHHLAFPGSMTLRPSTMIAAIYDWASSLARHGFDKIYFFNGHGGNVATIRAAFSEISVDAALARAGHNRSAVACRLKNWWDFPPVYDFCKTTYGPAHGAHATPSEIAVTQFAYPEAIKQAVLDPQIAPGGSFKDADDYRAKFPDGRIGSDPSLANPQDGERLIELAAGCLVEDFNQFVGG